MGNHFASSRFSNQERTAGFLMTRRITLTFAIVALSIVASATMLWSRPHPIALAAAAMPTLAELHATAGVSSLPVQEFMDQSLIFPREARK